MSSIKVSALTAKTTPSGSEELLINDGGTSKKITVTNLQANIADTKWDGGSTGLTAATGRTSLGLGTAATSAATAFEAADTDIVKKNVANTFSAQQTFKETAETVYTLSGLDIDPANGQIQIKTLTASVTFTESLATGQAVILGLNDGTSYVVTAWPTITWTKTGGTATAPTLATTGYTWILLWKVGSTLYGSEMGQP
jgi:hypothetical protein